MNTTKINPRIAVIIGLALLAATMRIIGIEFWNNSPLAQFTPLAAIALFAGHHFKAQWQSMLFMLAILFVSDMYLQQIYYKGKYGFLDNGFYIRYAIFIGITLFGKYLINKINVQNVLVAAIVAALSHWMLYDFIHWAAGGVDIRTSLPLTRNWAGLQQSYIQGIPFMRSVLAGTLVYSGVLFFSFEWMKENYKQLRVSIA